MRTEWRREMSEAFEDWWEDEGKDLVETAEDTETRGTAVAFEAGAQAMLDMLAREGRLA